MKVDIEEQAYWLLLAFRSGLSIVKVNEIIEIWCQQLGRTLQDFFAVSVEEWEATCNLDAKTREKLLICRNDDGNRPQAWSLQGERALLERLTQQGIHVVTAIDEHYPRTLRSSLKRSDMPPVLFYAGNLRILDRPSIALIGSRSARASSIAFTREAASYLAQRSVNVISGNARGVDQAAYEGAVSVGGYTTVVLPRGIGKLGKAQVQELRPHIESGKVLVLSQFHPDAPWMVFRAMERNKVVTGLSQVVIVAESDLKGGTWEGANYALSQKRSVYVRQPGTTGLLPGNDALIERSARPLYWPEDEYVYIDGVLSPVLREGDVLFYRQKHMTALSHQLSRLLREEGIYELTMDEM